MAKTSKWFVVATEGATTDGRTINRTWIEQMAANYDPKNTVHALILNTLNGVICGTMIRTQNAMVMWLV